MPDIFSTTDKTKEQQGQGSDQFYILKQGLIQIEPADFSGTTAYFSTEVARIPFDAPAGGILLNNFDIFHIVDDPAAEIQGDQEMIKLNYNFGTQKANARMWYRYWVGAPGYVGVNIDIYYTADDTTGSPYSADETQNFYYKIYSMSPLVV